MSLQLCSSSPYRDRKTDRTTEDRKGLGEHFSYAKMVSGVTGDKLFVCTMYMSYSYIPWQLVEQSFQEEEIEHMDR